MLQIGAYVFKRAETDEEFEGVHALNYRTFVSELAQYPDSGAHRLVDKFHHKNIYFIALFEGRVVGMVSVHNQPPFSIAERLPDPTLLSRPDINPMEVRLLAIEHEKRHSIAYTGLVWTLWQYAQQNGITHLFISGLKERMALYEAIGFEAVGPAVQGGKSYFVPMMCEVSEIGNRKRRMAELFLKRVQRQAAKEGPSGPDKSDITLDLKARPHRAGNLVCLLPGPVAIAPAVHDAFHRPPIYHRGADFVELYETMRSRLAALVRCRHVAILNGSGTLANEVVAATLSAEPRVANGLLLVNGEFGQRLVRQATRFGLSFDVLSWPWGKPWDLSEIERRLASDDYRVDWVWGVHQESSTGVLNDLPGLVKVARRFGCKVCADCVSSLGAVPLDLEHVYLASGASGKALGSYAGAALVFADLMQMDHLDTSRVPSYLDLSATLRTTGPRYTFPSPTLCALEAALEPYATPDEARASYERYRQLGVLVRQRLREVGLPPLADESCAAPVITTFAPPADEVSEAFVARCHFWGFAIGGASGYLQERRLVQIATMGAVRPEDVAPLFDHLRGPQVRPTRERDRTPALAR